MLLLGTKYQADSLIQEGIMQLRRAYPATVDANAEERMYTGNNDCISIANVTRALNVDDQLHLRVLYDCCQLDAGALAHGALCSTGDREQLDPVDLECCINGRSLLMNVRHKLGDEWFTQYALGCISPEECKPKAKEFLYTPRGDRLPAPGMHDPLSKFTPRKTLWFTKSCESLCAECSRYYQNEFREFRQGILDDLKSQIHVSENWLSSQEEEEEEDEDYEGSDEDYDSEDVHDEAMSE